MNLKTFAVVVAVSVGLYMFLCISFDAVQKASKADARAQEASVEQVIDGFSSNH